MIELHDISYAYTQNAIFKNTSCVLPQNEFIGILGPNGSGKTTLLKILTGLLKPQSGQLTINNKAHLSLKEKSRLIAYVAQSEEIFLPYTVRQIVMMGRAPYLGLMGFEQPSDCNIVEQCLTLTETKVFEDRLIQNLSGGEQQRVFLARALAQQTSILLLDEPISHLDLKHQIAFFSLIQKIRTQKPLTVIMTLHDLNLAACFCTHLLFLKDGRILGEGSPEQLMTSTLLSQVYDCSLSVTTLDGKKWVRPNLS